MDAGYEDERSPIDDLVVVVEVEPGPRFRIAEAADAEGTDAARRLASLLTTTDARVREAWETGRPGRFEIEHQNECYEVRIVPLASVDRLIVHLSPRLDRRQRRRDIVNAAIVDALPGSVALVDPTGVIRAVNAGWVRFGLERSHDGLLADAGTSYLDVTDRAAELDPSARAAADAIRSVLAGRVDLVATDYPAEGSQADAWFTVRVAPVVIDDERWAVVSHEDVTALRHAIDRWHATFSDAAVPTVIVNDRTEILDANAAFAELVGIELGSAIGLSTVELVHPDERDEVVRRMLRAEAGRPDTTPLELRVRRPDGVNLVVAVHPSGTTPGESNGAVVQLIDLTDQRRAETRLALHRELLELVAAGTPLADVATAVALNIRRAIDGASGGVELAGSAPFAAPGAADGWQSDPTAFRVPVDHARSGLGSVVIRPSAPLTPGDDEAAAMLASIVRLTVQRDEAAAAASTGFDVLEQLDDELGRSVEWLSRAPSTVAVLAVGPVDYDALLAERGWRGAEAVLADICATVREAHSRGSVVARRGNQILVLLDLDAIDDDPVDIGRRLAAREDVAIGIAISSTDVEDPDELLDHAADALSAARSGNERVAVFGPSMRARSADDAAADDLRRGIDDGEISVHYQPIIDLRSGGTVGLEALVRWEHPTRGFVSPLELIHTAEVCGLIREVGAIVLATACRDVARWRREGAAELTVAVNLSATQLAQDLVAVLESALAEHDLHPSALVVEITESVVVTDVGQVAEALAALRALGVHVAIDDFGTGYSSLLYLKHFPADVLKVDRSFVQGLGVHDGDTAIVEAVIGLGHRLGLEIVAEGVETATQLAELRRRRCDLAQGYLLQRPVPEPEISRFLRTGVVDLGPEPAMVPAPDLDVDEMLSLVTHELSTPLSVIGGHAELFADLLRRDDDSPAAVVEALERNIRNLDDLLRTLGGLSRALGTPGKTTTIELASFVEQTTNDLGPLLAEHDVRVTLLDRPVSVEVEPVALRQIITNLLSNAVKFTPPGTIVDVVVRSGDHHEVIVADRGSGVPPDRADQLFGRFSRLGSSQRGLGLGLHLARELARRHGGDLAYTPTPGGGATFVLEIPR